MESMENLQDQLFLLLNERKSDEANQILLKHPELTNKRRTDNYEHEVSTPLIEACRYGECTLVLVTYTLRKKLLQSTFFGASDCQK